MNCSFNNQPIIWWVSCPRLSNLESTRGLSTITTGSVSSNPTTAKFKKEALKSATISTQVSSGTTTTTSRKTTSSDTIQSQSKSLEPTILPIVTSHQSDSKKTAAAPSASQHKMTSSAKSEAHPRLPYSGASTDWPYKHYSATENIKTANITPLPPVSYWKKQCRCTHQHAEQQQCSSLQQNCNHHLHQQVTNKQHHHNHHLSEQQRHSYSISALPTIDLYGSYAILPATDAAAGMVGPYNNHHDNFYSPLNNIDGEQFYCCSFKNDHASTLLPPSGAAVCNCGHPQYKEQCARCVQAGLYADNQKKEYRNGCYFGYDCGNRLTDEEDSTFPALPDREFHLLHRNIPALRRTGVDTSGIRQYYYPDGGWGWIICGVSFLVHILTTGFQLSYGLLLFYAAEHLHNSNGSAQWLGALSWSMSMLVSPFVVTFCRRKSTRLMAVIGGLVLPLGLLFTSFATELGQVVFSYGLVFGVGVAMVRDSSEVMLGNYFKRRRYFVEMVVMSGEGVGIALFSVLLKEGVGEAGWRIGLQIIAGMLAMSFFIGLLYRPASLYHPQRRAIQHLKNQRKKLRENKQIFKDHNKNTAEYFFLNISVLNSATTRVLMMTSGVAALGIYTPIFTMSLNAFKGGSDMPDLVLLQTFLGVSTVLGIAISGILIRHPFQIGNFKITTQVLAQIFISTVAVSILFLSFIMGYKGLSILSWIYGIGFGGFRYSFKILTLERVKLKHFTRIWALLRCVEAIPVLISVPLTIFLNDYSLKYGRAGYYICSAAAAIAGIIIFFISYSNANNTQRNSTIKRKHVNGTLSTLHSKTLMLHQCKPVVGTNVPTDFVFDSCYYPMQADPINRSCISLSQIETENENTCRSLYCRANRPPISQQIHHDSIESHHPRARRMTETDIHAYNSQYRLNCHDSVEPRAGKHLQKSLSFIQNACCNGQWTCNCHNAIQPAYNIQGSTSFQRSLPCTCIPNFSYLQNSRSLSVPEGLSNLSKQCSCAQSKDIIYLPKKYSKSIRNLQGQQTPVPATKYQQRSQLMSRPVHFVEQITTSV